MKFVVRDIKCFMAVLLITSSITMALYLAYVDHDIATGVRWYIAQAFMLAGSLFGIDYYIHKLDSNHHGR